MKFLSSPSPGRGGRGGVVGPEDTPPRCTSGGTSPWQGEDNACISMKYIFGNWKMYLGYEESLALAKEIAGMKVDQKKVTVGVFPNFVLLHDVVERLRGSNIAVGAQNVSWSPAGAYTGAVSAYLVKDIGCEYALVGHSERRHIFGEHDNDVRKKVEACLSVGLIPVVCIGETKEDLDADKRQYRLKKQLSSVFDGLVLNGTPVLIAYEPVWAISSGTGNIPCTPADADDVIGWVKQELKQYTANEIPVLYGGSVDDKNVVSYLSREAIDGVLVGSASTRADSFRGIIAAAQTLS